MVSAGDFRNGVTLEIDGQVVQILEFQHVKPGKGAAFVRTKLKNGHRKLCLSQRSEPLTVFILPLQKQQEQTLC